MPYYIEILWESLEDHCSETEKIAPASSDIDNAYSALFNQAYRSNVSHWVKRLNRLEKLERERGKEFLNLLAQTEKVSFNDYFNISCAMAVVEIKKATLINSIY